jgi:diguanylate cyclase (GGDEF)-like protein
VFDDRAGTALEGLTGLHDAQMLASKLVEALHEPITSIGNPMTVTASIGVALCVAGEQDHAALLRRADAALYEAKRRGRDRYFCDSPLDTSVADTPPPLALQAPRV